MTFRRSNINPNNGSLRSQVRSTNQGAIEAPIPVEDIISEALNPVGESVSPDSFVQDTLRVAHENTGDVVNDLKRLLNDYVDNTSFNYPNVLSHETVKTLGFSSNALSRPGHAGSSSDNNLGINLAKNLFLSHIDNVHEMNAFRLFNSSIESDLILNTHYKKVKEKVEETQGLFKDLNFIFENENRLKSKYNFGNHFRDFYIEGNTRKTFNKVYNKIFVDFNSEEGEYLRDSTKSSDEDLSFLNFNPYSTEENKHISLENLQDIYQNVFRYRDNNEDILFDENIDRKRIINSDKVFGQLLVNSSLSLSEPYFSCWGVTQDLRLNEDQSSALRLLNSYALNKFTILQLNYSIDHLLTSNNVTKNILNPVKSFSIDSETIKNQINDDYTRNNRTLNSFAYYDEKIITKKLEKNLGFYLHSLDSQSLGYNFIFDTYNIDFKFDSLLATEQETGRRFYFKNIVEVSANDFSRQKSNYLDNLLGYDYICHDRYNTDGFDNIDGHNLYFYSLDFLSENNKFRNFSDDTKEILSSPLFSYFLFYKNKELDQVKEILINQSKASDLGDSRMPINNSSSFNDTINYPFQFIRRYQREGRSPKIQDYISVDDFVKNTKIIYSFTSLEDSISKEKIKYSSHELSGESGTKLFQTINESSSQNLTNTDLLFVNSGSEIFDINSNRLSNIKSDKIFPFVFLKNSNKTTPNILEKFINLNPDLTTKDEYFFDRIISSSQSTENLDKSNDIKDIKNLSIFSASKEKGTDWFYKVFELKRIINQIKFIKLENDNIFSFMTNFKNKVLSKKEKSLVFLHEENNIDSIFNFENSQFVVKDEESIFSKSNFINTNSKIQSTAKTLLNENILPEDLLFSKDMTVKDFRKFLAKYFPKNFLRNSSSFLNRILHDVNQTIKNISRQNILEKSNQISFEKLLSDALQNGNTDTVKYLIFTSLCKHNDLFSLYENWDSDEKRVESYKKINSLSNEFYKDYCNAVFNRKNIENQKSYTIRVFTDEFLESDALISENLLDGELETTLGFFGFVDSRIKQFIFPFLSHDIFFPHNSALFQNSLIHGDFPNGGYSLYTKMPNSELPSEKYPESLPFINQFINAHTFNHDNYLVGYEYSDDNKTTRPNIDEGVQFDVDNQKCELHYYVLKEDSSGIFNQGNLELMDNFSDPPYKKINLEDNPTLNYTNKGIEIYDRFPLDLKLQNSISNNLYNYIIDILKYLNKDKFENVNLIADFINNENNIVEAIFKVLKNYCTIYSTMIDQIIELSVRSSLNEVIETNINVTSFKNLNGQFMWNNDIRDLCLGNINIPLEEYKNVAQIDNILKRENNFQDTGNVFYTKSHSEIQLLLRTLNNSDHLEALTFDAIHSYLYNNEKIVESFSEIVDDTNRITSNFLNTLSLVSAIENLDAIDIINKDLKLCKVSKNLQNNIYFNIELYNKLYPPNTELQNVIVKNIYENIDLFSHRKLEIERSLDLSKISLENIYNKEDDRPIQKFDILRFGIDYNIADQLRNERLLNVRVYVSNHRYPEIVFKPIDFYYTPVLTNVTPAHYDALASSAVNLNEIKNHIGYYDFDALDFENKYSVIDEETARGLLLNNIQNNNIINFLFNNDVNFSIDPETASFSILNDMKMSNFIKNANFIKNKIFDDNKINRINLEKDNILSSDSIEIFDSLSSESFEKIFLEIKSTVDEFLIPGDNFSSKDFKLDLINSNIHSLDTMKLIDKDISKIDAILEFTSEEFFDIFSIKISRPMIRDRIFGGEDEVRRIYDLSLGERLPMDNIDFDDSYSYIIEMQVI